MRTAITMLAVTGVLLLGHTTLHAQDAEKVERPEMRVLFKKLEQTLSGAVLTGQFTVLGKSGPPREEEYRIESVEKVKDGSDYWIFNARIKYGDKDISVPMPLKVKWAGDTPVITLSNTTIPGLGTFSSRVVIYNNKYAGTWTHGKVGGHLFGTIKKLESSDSKKPAPRNPAPRKNAPKKGE